MSELTVINEDPVNLDGTLDTTENLQFQHTNGNLANYNQTLLAKHEDYNDPGGFVRVKLLDFSGGGNTWQITATHGRETWSRDGNHAFYDFGLVDNLEVNIIATSNASPPQQKTRTILIKTQPTDPLPDGP